MCAVSHVIEPTDRVCKHSFACGLCRMCAFSHVIEPTDRVCKHSFACGLRRMCAFSHVIEPTVGFVSTALHVDCAKCMNLYLQVNQL